MTNKAPAIISTVLTAILLIIVGILSILFEMLALNGASESQGMTAMGISLVCQGVGVILAAGFSGWFTNLLISRFKWNQVVAIFAAVFSGTMLGTGLAFLALIISIPAAGIN